MNNLFDHTKFRERLFDFNISSFREKALQLFSFQYHNNAVYRQYCNGLRIDAESVSRLSEIPFLPISFFKTHDVKSGSFEPEVYFESSGTTGSINSLHVLKDAGLYRDSFLHGFRDFYGDPGSWCVIGLLPSYLERQHSSLVVMVDELVRLGHADSGFHLYDYAKLSAQLTKLESVGQRVLLIGVTYALLDFAMQYPMNLSHTVIMETGGMKGRRKEMTRIEVHEVLQKQFSLPAIHAEYGMTELLSQAYSNGEGVFSCANTMKILIREEDDPFIVYDSGLKKRGIINVIDLANIWSCAFIATDDAGILHEDGRFEVLGRIDHSDVRGCSLMVV